jgi:pyrroline-5-carboxylate reductase
MKIGFIGIGKIAAAIVEGLCTSGIENTMIYLSPRNRENSLRLAKKFSNVKRLDDNQKVLDEADIIFISVTPAIAKTLLPLLIFKAQHTIVSLVPVLSSNWLRSKTHPACHISRAIPLPPVMYHNCPIPVFNPNTEVTALLSYLGQPLIVDDEYQLHALWTLTGLITPFYDLLGELSSWTIQKGVDEQVTNQYIAGLYQSLTSMAQRLTPIHFNELAKHAATPNGMNEQAGSELRQKGAHQLYFTAADNLYQRFINLPDS